MKKDTCGKYVYNKGMNYFKNAISKLYDAASTPVATTSDAFAKKLQNVHDATYSLHAIF